MQTKILAHHLILLVSFNYLVYSSPFFEGRVVTSLEQFIEVCNFIEVGGINLKVLHFEFCKMHLGIQAGDGKHCSLVIISLFQKKKKKRSSGSIAYFSFLISFLESFVSCK